MITYPFFFLGLLYRFIYPTQLGYHLLILPLFLVFLYKNFLAPGDIKFLLGFSLWNTFASVIWMMLFTLILLGFTNLITQKKFPNVIRIPVAPFFLASYFLVFVFYHIYPVASLIYS